MLKRTPLHELHANEGARMVPFAGFEMPVQYTSILAEHRSVREAAGLFDVSHMGRFRICGPGALTSVQRALSNDASRLAAGQCQYSLLLTQTGGIADDLFVYSPRGTEDEIALVVNAANAAKDYHMLGLCLTDAEMTDETGLTAMVAVQGPRAAALVQGLADVDLGTIRLHRFATITVAGVRAVTSRTGYTGEDGFEITTAAEDGPVLWTALRRAGAMPCGLGARDVLRLEAAYPLWGHEISEETLPADVGLERYCAATKDYVGREAHEDYLAAGPRMSLVGLRMKSKRIARDGDGIRLSGADLGSVTSGGYSPVHGAGVALAHVANPSRIRCTERAAELVGAEVTCVSGRVEIPAEVVQLPFYRRRKLAS